MFFNANHRIDARFLRWPDHGDMRKFPAAALRDAVRQARKAGFYKTRLPEPLHWDYAGWKGLPSTTKADLRQSYPLGFLAEPMHRVASYHESSGTSGQPTATLFTEGDWDDVITRFMRSRIGLGAHDVVFIKTPYSLVTTAHQMERAARLVGATVIPADNRSRNMPYAKVVRLLHQLPVTVAWCMPTEALLWAEAAKLAGLDPSRDFPHLRAFFVAGEPLSVAKRRRIAELWGGIDVIQDYGSTETGSLAGECPEGRLHLWADRVFPEILDSETGNATTCGRGALVVTTLFREAMPLIRYETQDEVQLTYKPCGCGWNLPTVQVLGRLGHDLAFGGGLISPLELENTVYSLPANFAVQFWRARRRDGDLELEIGAAPEWASTACDELACAIFHRFGVKAFVEAVPVDTFIPREVLVAERGFQKPKFLFDSHEDWSHSLVYAQ